MSTEAALERLAALNAADQERERQWAMHKELKTRLRVQGVAFFDSDDDFSFEFLTRDLYLPSTLQSGQSTVRFGLFLGWPFTNDIANAFLNVAAYEAPIVAWTFLEMQHQGGGHMTVQQSFLVAPVRMMADGEAVAEAIVKHYYFSLLRPDATEQNTSEYIELVGQHGLETGDALARTTNCLMESVYPLDASQTNLVRLAVDPDRHKRLFKPFMNNDLLAKTICFFLISDNCD